MKKLGVILSFVVALGSLVLIAAALIGEDSLQRPTAPFEDADKLPEPVITITDIPATAALVAPATQPGAAVPAGSLDEAGVHFFNRLLTPVPLPAI